MGVKPLRAMLELSETDAWLGSALATCWPWPRRQATLNRRTWRPRRRRRRRRKGGSACVADWQWQ